MFVSELFIDFFFLYNNYLVVTFIYKFFTSSNVFRMMVARVIKRLQIPKKKMTLNDKYQVIYF